MGIDSVWFYIPHVIYIRISTVVMIVVIMTVATVPWTRHSHVANLDSDNGSATVRTHKFGVASLTVLAWLGSYEIVWQLGYAAFGHELLRPALQFSLAVFGWLLFANALHIRPDRYLFGLWALSIVAWMALGFHANFPGHPFSVLDEVINEVGKTALGIAYLLGALRRPQRQRQAVLQTMSAVSPLTHSVA